MPIELPQDNQELFANPPESPLGLKGLVEQQQAIYSRFFELGGDLSTNQFKALKAFSISILMDDINNNQLARDAFESDFSVFNISQEGIGLVRLRAVIWGIAGLDISSELYTYVGNKVELNDNRINMAIEIMESIKDSMISKESNFRLDSAEQFGEFYGLLSRLYQYRGNLDKSIFYTELSYKNNPNLDSPFGKNKVKFNAIAAKQITDLMGLINKGSAAAISIEEVVPLVNKLGFAQIQLILPLLDLDLALLEDYLELIKNKDLKVTDVQRLDIISKNLIGFIQKFVATNSEPITKSILGMSGSDRYLFILKSGLGPKLSKTLDFASDYIDASKITGSEALNNELSIIRKDEWRGKYRSFLQDNYESELQGWISGNTGFKEHSENIDNGASYQEKYREKQEQLSAEYSYPEAELMDVIESILVIRAIRNSGIHAGENVSGIPGLSESVMNLAEIIAYYYYYVIMLLKYKNQ